MKYTFHFNNPLDRHERVEKSIHLPRKLGEKIKEFLDMLHRHNGLTVTPVDIVIDDEQVRRIVVSSVYSKPKSKKQEIKNVGGKQISYGFQSNNVINPILKEDPIPDVIDLAGVEVVEKGTDTPPVQVAANRRWFPNWGRKRGNGRHG